MNRKKRLLITQFGLLILGTLIIFYTYYNKKNYSDDPIITSEVQKKIKDQLNQQSQQDGDVFLNIKYSGLDLAGNRYILESEEAVNNKSDPSIVNMKVVEANFYFKDGTVLKVLSNKGIYNNKTLDMIFNGDVKAFYEGSRLFAEKAEYSNLSSFLTITENVKVEDVKGTIFADKLFFDIKKQTLNIASFNDSKINANINLK